jgi:hypothetical protein
MDENISSKVKKFSPTSTAVVDRKSIITAKTKGTTVGKKVKVLDAAALKKK